MVAISFMALMDHYLMDRYRTDVTTMTLDAIEAEIAIEKTPLRLRTVVSTERLAALHTAQRRITGGGLRHEHK